MIRLARPFTLAAAAGLIALSTAAVQAQGLPKGAERGYTTGARAGGPILGGAGAVVGGVVGAGFGVVGADPGRCAYGACKKRGPAARHVSARKKPMKRTVTTTRPATATSPATTTTTTTTTTP